MFGDLGKIMKMVGEMKTKMPAMQAQLAAAEYVADAGGGAVKAIVNGKGALVGLTIAPATLGDLRTDAATLEGLVKAAVNAAQNKAADAAASAMKELTGGFELPPGLGL